MTDEWQAEYREALLLKSRVDALARELWDFSTALSKRMAALSPLPDTDAPESPASPSTEPTTPQTRDRSIVCNFPGKGDTWNEAWCDLWFGHLDEGFAHYFQKPRAYVSRENPMTLEEAEKLVPRITNAVIPDESF